MTIGRTASIIDMAFTSCKDDSQLNTALPKVTTNSENDSLNLRHKPSHQKTNKTTYVFTKIETTYEELIISQQKTNHRIPMLFSRVCQNVLLTQSMLLEVSTLPATLVHGTLKILLCKWPQIFDHYTKIFISNDFENSFVKAFTSSKNTSCNQSFEIKQETCTYTLHVDITTIVSLCTTM